MSTQENLLIVGTAGAGAVLVVTLLHLGIFVGVALFGLTLMGCFL